MTEPELRAALDDETLLQAYQDATRRPHHPVAANARTQEFVKASMAAMRDVLVARLKGLCEPPHAEMLSLADVGVTPWIPTHTRLTSEIASALNRASAENESNTPDYILAKFLLSCLGAWDNATRERERWYRRDPNARLETAR